MINIIERAVKSGYSISIEPMPGKISVEILGCDHLGEPLYCAFEAELDCDYASQYFTPAMVAMDADRKRRRDEI